MNLIEYFPSWAEGEAAFAALIHRDGAIIPEVDMLHLIRGREFQAEFRDGRKILLLKNPSGDGCTLTVRGAK